MREALALRAGGFETLKAMANQFRIMDHVTWATTWAPHHQIAPGFSPAEDHSGELTKEEFMTALDVFLKTCPVNGVMLDVLGH